jgi:predicted deacylase
VNLGILNLRYPVPNRHHKRRADRSLSLALARGDSVPQNLDRPAVATMGRALRRAAIELHVFPGRSSRKALVIGGVHGNEIIGVDVTRQLIAELQRSRRPDRRPFFTTLVIPALFPDNLPRSHGGRGRGRRSTPGRADPNRQFPHAGSGLDAELGRPDTNIPRDALGRLIEPANVVLIELIRRDRPERIASVHAIRRGTSAGVYADPHRAAGTVLGHAAADLAQRMHAIARACGAHVPGSSNGSGAYPHQRDVGRDGVSLGVWASRTISMGAYRRGAVPVITLELKRDWSRRDAERRRINVAAFVRAIRMGFLEP